jgi:hypothetical protein
MMYENEVTVTTSTRTQLKVTADWPLIWLQAPGSIEILRKLLPREIVSPVTSMSSSFNPNPSEPQLLESQLRSSRITNS